MDKYSFSTVAKPAEYLITEKGSKFYAYCYPFSKPEELKLIIETLKKQHIKASHFCYAYLLNDGSSRSSDDGEPSGTAGKPILNAILSKKIEDVLVVVVRYFGGTLLGVPGLISAYKLAALSTMNSAEIIVKHYTVNISIAYSFEHVNVVQKMYKKLNVKILSQEFTDKYQDQINLKKQDYAEFMAELGDVYGVEIR